MKKSFCCKTSSDVWFTLNLEDIPDEFKDYEIHSGYYSIPCKNLTSIINVRKLTGVYVPYNDIVYLSVVF